MRGGIALVAVVFVAFAGGRARGDDAKLAKQHFEDGSRLYDLGKYADAAREYQEAYKLKPVPALLFNIGQAYRGAGNTTEALTAYKSYLRKVPEAPNRVDVEGFIVKLQETLDAERAAQKQHDEEERQRLLQQQQAQQQQQQTPRPDLVATAPPAEKQPIYKKWWLWTAIGGVLVVGGVVAIAVATTTPKDAVSPPNTFGVSFK